MEHAETIIDICKLEEASVCHAAMHKETFAIV